MDIQIRKQLEQLEYIKDKLEYIEYSESLQCYVEKLNGIPTGVAAWVNGAFYGFEQAKAQAVPEWISVKNAMPKAGSWFVAYNDFNGFIDTGKADGDEDPNNVFFSHWLPLPKAPVKQEPAND